VSIQGDILSVRLSNRARLIRMLVAREWNVTRKELRHELAAIARELDRDAERVMALEIRKGGSL
jgi:hypothetical protein